MSYFGTVEEVAAVRARRREEILAWGKGVLEEADRAQGLSRSDDWSAVHTTTAPTPEPEPEPVVETVEVVEVVEAVAVTEALPEIEEVVEVVTPVVESKPAPKKPASSSKGATAAK